MSTRSYFTVKQQHVSELEKTSSCVAEAVRTAEMMPDKYAKPSANERHGKFTKQDGCCCFIRDLAGMLQSRFSVHSATVLYYTNSVYNM